MTSRLLGVVHPAGLGLLIGGGLLGATLARDWLSFDQPSSIDAGAVTVTLLAAAVLLAGTGWTGSVGAVLAGLTVTALLGGALGGPPAIALGAVIAGLLAWWRGRTGDPKVLAAPVHVVGAAAGWAWTTALWMRTFDESGTSRWYDVETALLGASLTTAVVAAALMVCTPHRPVVPRLAVLAPVLVLGLAASSVRDHSTCNAVGFDAEDGSIVMTSVGCGAGLGSQLLPVLVVVLVAGLVVASARAGVDGYATALTMTLGLALPAVVVLARYSSFVDGLFPRSVRGPNEGLPWAAGLALAGAVLLALAALGRRRRTDSAVDQITQAGPIRRTTA